MDQTRTNLKEALHQFEKMLIMKALKDADFNKAHAASLLSVNRTTLIGKMRRVGLSEFIHGPSGKDKDFSYAYSKVERE